MPQDISTELAYYLVCCANGATAPINIELNPTNVTYSGYGNGYVQSYVTGGFAPYTYLWSNGSTADAIYNVGPGIYTLTVTDNNNHTATATATVTEPDPLSVNLRITEPDCNGVNVIYDMDILGGAPSYFYYWIINGNYFFTTPISAPAGLWSLTVQDAVASIDLSGTASEPTAITAEMDGANETFTGANDGTATVTASGGTPGYTYLWNTGATTITINDLVPGTYTVTVTVTDSKGCTADFEFIVGTLVPKFLFYKPAGPSNPVNSADVITQYDTGIFTNTAIETLFNVGTPGMRTVSIFFATISGEFISDIFYADSTSSLSFWTDVNGWLYMNNYDGVVYDAGTDRWLVNDSKNISYVEILNSTP